MAGLFDVDVAEIKDPKLMGERNRMAELDKIEARERSKLEDEVSSLGLDDATKSAVVQAEWSRRARPYMHERQSIVQGADQRKYQAELSKIQDSSLDPALKEQAGIALAQRFGRPLPGSEGMVIEQAATPKAAGVVMPGQKPGDAPQTQSRGPMGGGSSVGALRGLGREMAKTSADREKRIDTAEANLMSIRGQQRDALEERGKMAVEQAGQRAEAFNDLQRKTTAIEAFEAEKRQTLNDAFEDQKREVARMRAEVREKKVDPDRMFRDKDGSTNWTAKAVSSIAIALGELGRSFSGGGPNAAMQIINNAIDRDIMAQQEDIAGSERALGEAKEGMREVVGEMGMLDDATLRRRVQAREAYSMKIDEITANNAPREAQAQIQEMKLQMDADQEKDLAALAEREGARRLEGLAMRQGNVLAQDQARTSQIQRAAAMAKARPGGMSLPGLRGTPITKEAANDAVEMKGSIDFLFDSIDRAIKHVDEEGFTSRWTGSGAAQATGEALKSSIDLEVKGPLADLGVLAGGDMALIESLTSDDLGSMRSGEVKARLEELKRYVAGKADKFLRARGLEMPGLGKPSGAQ